AIIVTSIPIFTAAFSALLGVERLQGRRLAGIAVAMAGVLTLFGPSALGGGQLVGNLCIVVNCACYALFLVLSHPLREEMDSITMSAWVFFLGFLMMLPLGLMESRLMLWQYVSVSAW